MPATPESLRRVLTPLQSPLRFASRGEQAIASLRGLELLARNAVEAARALPLDPLQAAALDRLLVAAHRFEGEGGLGRRDALAAIAVELARLGVRFEPPSTDPAARAPDRKAEQIQGVARPPPPPPLPVAAPVKPVPAPPLTSVVEGTLPAKRVETRVRTSGVDETKAPVDPSVEALLQPLSTVRGVGPAVAEKLAARRLHTVGDVLFFLPRKYEDRRHFSSIGSAKLGENALIRARIVGFHERFMRRKSYELELDDGTGLLVARWFGFKPGAWRGFIEGASVIVSGEVRGGFKGRKEITHPDLELGDDIEDLASFGVIVPVYTEVEGISQRAYRRMAQKVAEGATRHVRDFLTDEFRAAHDLVPLAEALKAVHFPSNDADFPNLARFTTPPQRRLVFDELFFVQLGLALRKRGVQVDDGVPLKVDGPTIERALARLPFPFTNAQRRSFMEIARDVSRPVPMNRLLQGDVGSGKTAVALATALLAVENGYQAAVMAPTELLAEQHLRTFEKLLGSGLFDRKPTNGGAALPPVQVALLAASRKPKDQMRARNEIASGAARIAIGTHALIQGDVKFQDLAVVIVDEQHRFGVLQRQALMEKGRRPHVLVMTATPIPRTLALTLYGDLDVSTIDELPPGRTPVTTKSFSGKQREKAYELVRKEVAAGRQAYVVLPLVEESEKLDLRSATEEYERLSREELAGLKLGLVHGRLSPEERTLAMEAFRRNETQVLVATTVIEVGVDVPNASVMLIEHAERFGLSQLHQLRGRVGRGAAKSWCLLVGGDAGVSDTGYQRMQTMVRTANGFELAEEDLKQRGPGEFLGTRQSGVPDLVVADLLRDQKILTEARAAAFAIVKEDPELRQARHQGIARELMRRWAGKLGLARVG